MNNPNPVPANLSGSEAAALIRYTLDLEKLLLEFIQTRPGPNQHKHRFTRHSWARETTVVLGTRPQFLPDDGELPGVPGPLVCLKFAVHRNDDLPGFGGFLRPCHPSVAQILPMSIILNVGSLFSPTLTDESGGAVSVTPKERIRNVITTLMHEVGHALESHFNEDLGEESIDAIITGWERQWRTGSNGGLEPIDPEIVEEVRRRRMLGEKTEAIAQHYGVTQSWVSKVTRHLAVKRANSMTDDEINRAVELRREGKSWRDVAAILGRNWRTVWKSVSRRELAES